MLFSSLYSSSFSSSLLYLCISDQKEGELTLLLTNSLIDGSGANSEEFKKVIKQYEEENPGVKITLQGASQQDIKESFQTAVCAPKTITPASITANALFFII